MRMQLWHVQLCVYPDLCVRVYALHAACCMQLWRGTATLLRENAVCGCAHERLKAAPVYACLKML